MNRNSKLPGNTFLASTALTGFIVLFLIGFVFYTAAPVLGKEGIGFVTGTTWSYDDHEYGIALFIAGTLVLTAVTIAIAFPLGLLTAIFLTEWAPVHLERMMRPSIELLVGIPSVVYGIFGFFVLENVFQNYVNPFISHTFGFIQIFEYYDPNCGSGILLASTVLAVMVLPTIVALSQEAMRAVPREYRDASYALGATKWETISGVVLPAASTGILTGLILGLMRAMGETMAVVMLIGNSAHVPRSIMDTGYAMTSKILNDIGFHCMYPEHLSALFAIGAVLFAMEMGFVAIMRYVGSMNIFGGK